MRNPTLATAWRLAALILLGACAASAADVPQDVAALWADVDPRAEPLDVRVAKEWTENGALCQVLTYRVGTFKGTEARMAAFYARPKEAAKAPGLLHLHGGGQRASLYTVQYHAGRGYACLSLNWGGRPLDDKHPDWPMTDWGAVDPTQQNVPGYSSLKPTPKTLAREPSPTNNNWYLLTLAARRGLTLLERRPEVDAQRLGVIGHSMGGRITFMTAGCDDRVRAAVPSVGGVGFRTVALPGLPGPVRTVDGSEAATALYQRTLASETYAPRMRCPILFLGATNDFNSWTERAYRCYALLPHREWRITLSPHLNHRFRPEEAVCRPLWLDAHLKGGFAFPESPRAELQIETEDGVPQVRVRTYLSQQVADVAIYYSVDPHPVARFWRDARARRDADAWTAACPVMSLDHPLVALANVSYRLDEPVAPPHARATERFTLTSNLVHATAADLRQAGVRATDSPSLVIDDFARGTYDWYVLAPENPHHWQFWTRKVTDPKWRGPAGARLAMTVTVQRDNTFVLLVRENEWRAYRGKRKEYAAEIRMKGSDAPQTIRLSADDLKEISTGEPLGGWAEIDQLGIRAYADIQRDGKPVRLGGRWDGPQPEFHLLKWALPEAP